MAGRDIAISLSFVNKGIEQAASQIKLLSDEMKKLNDSFKGMSPAQIKAIMKAISDQSKQASGNTKKQVDSNKELLETWNQVIQVGHQVAASMENQGKLAYKYGQSIHNANQKKAMSIEWDQRVLAIKAQLEKRHMSTINQMNKEDKLIFGRIATEEKFNQKRRTSQQLQEREAKLMIQKTALAAKASSMGYQEYKIKEKMDRITKSLNKEYIESNKAMVKRIGVEGSLARAEERTNKILLKSDAAIKKYEQDYKAMGDVVIDIEKNISAAKTKSYQAANKMIAVEKKRIAESAKLKHSVRYEEEMARAKAISAVTSKKIAYADKAVAASLANVTSKGKVVNSMFANFVNVLKRSVKSARALYRANKMIKNSFTGAWTGAQRFIATMAGMVFTLNQGYIWFMRLGRAMTFVYRTVKEFTEQYAELIRVARSASFILKTSIENVMEAASSVTLLGINMKEAATGLDEFGRAGYHAKEAMSAFVPIAMFAKASNTELGRSTTMVTGSMKAFGFEAKDVGRITSGMINAIYKSRNSFASLETAMSYAAAAGGAFGQEYEEVLATVSAFRDLGLQESTSGTAYRRSIAKFAFISDGVKTMFQEMGLEAEDFQLNAMRSFNDVISKLAQLKDKVSDVKLGELVNKMVGVRFGAYVKKLIDATYEGRVNMHKMAEDYKADSGLLIRLTKKNMTTITHQVDVMKGIYAKLLTMAGGGISRLVNGWVAAFNYLTNTILDKYMKKMKLAIKSFKELSDQDMDNLFNNFEKDVLIKMSKIVLKIREFNDFMLAASSTITIFVDSIKFMGIALGFVGTLLAGAIGLIGLLGTSIIAIFSNIGTVISNSLNSMYDIVKWHFDHVMNFLVFWGGEAGKYLIEHNPFTNLIQKDVVIKNVIETLASVLKAVDQWNNSMSAKTLKLLTGASIRDTTFEKNFRDMTKNLTEDKGVKTFGDEVAEAIAAIDKETKNNTKSLKTRAELLALNKKRQEESDKAMDNVFDNDSIQTSLTIMQKSSDAFWDLGNAAINAGADSGLFAKRIVDMGNKLDELATKANKAGHAMGISGLKLPEKPNNMLTSYSSDDSNISDLEARATKQNNIVNKAHIDAVIRRQKLEEDLNRKFADAGFQAKARTLLREQYIQGAASDDVIDMFNEQNNQAWLNGEISTEVFESKIMYAQEFRDLLNITTEEEIEHLQNLSNSSTEFQEIFSLNFMAAAASLGTMHTMIADLANDMVGTMQTGMANMFMSIFDKSKKIKDVLKDMGKSMLQSLMTYLSKMIIQTLVFGKIMTDIQKKQSISTASGMAVGAQVAAYRRGMESAPGAAGLIAAKAFLAEAKVTTTALLVSMKAIDNVKGHNKGTGLMGVQGVGSSDTVPAMLTPGEIVLNNEESDMYRQRAMTGGGDTFHINIDASDSEGQSYIDKLIDTINGNAEVRRAMKTSLARQGA